MTHRGDWNQDDFTAKMLEQGRRNNLPHTRSPRSYAPWPWRRWSPPPQRRRVERQLQAPRALVFWSSGWVWVSLLVQPSWQPWTMPLNRRTSPNQWLG